MLAGWPATIRQAVLDVDDSYLFRLGVRPRSAAIMSDSYILVVDDHEGIRSLIAEILGNEGYEIEGAEDGAQALAAIERRVPRLVLLDMRMPVLNGWELARSLKERGIDVPLVVMTAAQKSKDWAAEIGAVGYLAKPFGVQALVDLVRDLPVQPAENLASPPGQQHPESRP